MSKSYWFKDWLTENGQRGNFSNNKQDTFNPQEGFIGTRLQQGVPLLDRDWNELEDIRRYQDVMLRKHYLGNGTPDDGFRISAIDPPANDFMISAGRFLVDGFEAVNEPGWANFMQFYSSQTGLPALTKIISTSPIIKATRKDIVYLDVWIEEVTGADLERLKNKDDVNMVTCIRHRLRWVVRVDEGNLGHTPDVGHHFYDLARITRTSARDSIASADVEDLRPSWQSLESAQSMLRNAINSLISGNMPSGPTMDLATIDYYSSLGTAKDDLGNITLFWQQGDQLWAKRYSADTRTWGADMQLTSGTGGRFFIRSFNDSRGDTWVFWQQNQQDGDITIYSLWAKRYSASTGKWTGDIQLTPSGALWKEYLNVFDDGEGNIWFFWGETEEGTGALNFWAKKYASGKWTEDTQLTTGKTYKYKNNIFIDSKKCVWFFWSQYNEKLSAYNLLARRFGEGSWSGEFPLATGATDYTNSIEDKNGIIWFIWMQADANSVINNIWYKRFASGRWTDDTQLTSGTMQKSNWNSFMDARGDIWIFWQQADSTWNIWGKRLAADGWSNDMQLTNGSTNIYSPNNPLAGKERDIFFIYSLADSNNIYNIFAQIFNFDTNQWELSNITYGPGDKSVSNIFQFSNGNIGLFWIQDNHYLFNMFIASEVYWTGTVQVANASNAYLYTVLEMSNGDVWLLLYGPPYLNMWCTRFIDGDWVGQERLTSGAVRKNIINVFEGVAGDIWAFWMTYSINQSAPSQIKAKKFFHSI